MKNPELGENLKARRLEKGLTLAELKELSGVDVSYLGRIERDERYPSALILQRLTEPLGYGEAELLKLAGYLTPDETDERISEFKVTMKGEIGVAMANLMEKVDTL